MQDLKYRSSKLVRAKKHRRYFRFFAILILLVAIIWSISYFSFHPKFAVNNIEITGTEFSNRENIFKITNNILNQKLFFLLSARNYFFLPKFSIKEQIEKSEIAIEDISIIKTNFNSIQINITEYPVVAKWCFVSDSRRCVLLNEKAEKIADEPKIFLDKTILLTTDDEKIYNTEIEEGTFTKIVGFTNFMNMINLSVSKIYTKDLETFSVFVDAGPEIIIDKFSDPKLMAENLNAVIEKDAISRAQLANIKYIDLRFGNKVYYKIK